ncbi:haeIIM [Symbiodinium sp. CCMP2592]|nr:haeIIM [Symbiodinium sp. CCMP2592]
MDDEDQVMAFMPRKRHRALTRVGSNDSGTRQPRSRCVNGRDNLEGTNDSLLPLPQKAFQHCGKPGLLVGSACSGWSCESQALTNLEVPHTISFLCDSDRHVEKWLRHNVVFERFHRDVFHDAFMNEQKVDIFAAGPPCQPFSPEGANAGDDDSRAHVIQPIKTYICQAQPRAFILENVASWSNSDIFRQTMDDLGGLKNEDGLPVYNIYRKVLQTCHYGVAQNRSRLYVVGLLADEDKGFKFPEAFNQKPDIADLLDSRELPRPIKDISEISPELANSTSKTRQKCLGAVLSHFEKTGECPWTSHIIVDTQHGRSDARFYKDCFPTLTAARCQQRAYFNLRLNRYHTMSELFRAQGADPEGMDMTCISEHQLGHLAGNAMSVNVMTHLLGSIMLSW